MVLSAFLSQILFFWQKNTGIDRSWRNRYKKTMKRTLIAPLLSALMPGVGQIINRQFPKAGLFIAGFSIFLMALFFKVLYDLNQVMMSLSWELLEKDPHRFQTITQALGQRSKTVLLVLLILLVGFWAYNVWDAFSQARKTEGGDRAPSPAG
jgi:hypothetical protein